MALTSSSTLSDAQAQYNDNLSWDNDAAKAVLALEAVRWLLANRPESTSREGLGVNYASLESEKEKLEQFIADQTLSVAGGSKGFKLTKLRPGGTR